MNDAKEKRALLEEVARVAEAAASAAGSVITDIRSSGKLKVSIKPDTTLVTTADTEAERLIIGRIKEHFPSHKILSEENYPQLEPVHLGQGPLWVIDPLDGTTNYARGHNQVAVSIAFVLDGVVEYGIVHAPFQNETFSAERSGNAYLNGRIIEVSKPVGLKSALIATGFAYRRSDVALLVKRVQAVLEHCQDLRRVGAAALDICWVASGRLDGFYESLNPWDMAAGLLIAKQAGAKAGRLAAQEETKLPPDLNGQELLVASPTIFDDLLRILSSAEM